VKPRRRILLIVAAILLLTTSLGWLLYRMPTRRLPPQGMPLVTDQPVAIPSAEAQSCAKCHADIYNSWLESQHAWANRMLDLKKDHTAFLPAPPLRVGDHHFTTFVKSGKPRIDLGGTEYAPEAVIGLEPLRQYLIPFPGGRWQPLNPGFDPARREWFDIFAGENRQPNEWGHWTNRGENWNSQCAVCHMTGLDKGYDEETDTYRTTWKAMGISCSQCHANIEEHLKNPTTPSAPPSKEQIEFNCASCHSRREELTGKFQPGENYFDHYRPMLADVPGTFYPDGQVLDEDFEFGSFLMSRMHHKGVSCLDCHNPHSGKLVLPGENNALCLSCHSPPGRNQAIPIDSAQHMFHKDGSPGGRCVDCHMRQNPFMQRDPRRDHGFNIPDPLLTKQLGVPNSCNRCHADKSPDWAIEWTTKWYGEKMNRRSRSRALVVDRAQKQDGKVLGELVTMAGTEEVAGWKAVFAGLLAPWAGDPAAAAALRKFVDDPEPMVRAAAVHALGSNAPLEMALNDSSRLVRLNAFQASRGTAVKNDSVRTEYLQFLRATHDQPVGALHEADLALAEGRHDEAESWTRKAAQWDPSAGGKDALGQVLHALGKDVEAEAAFRKAIDLDPKNPQRHFTLALFYAETKKLNEAVKSLSAAVEIDPTFGRAWYNLGLAYSQTGQINPALTALDRASNLMPESPEPTYALATILARQGKAAEAQAAAQESLRRSPGFTPALELLDSLGR